MLLPISLAQAQHELVQATHTFGPSVVAFDGDGTLWTGDIADDVVEALITQKLLRPACVPALTAALTAHLGLPPKDTDPHALFHTLLAEDRAGRFDHRVTCELIGSLLAGWTRSEMHAFCIEVLRAAKLETRTIEESWAIRRMAKELGHQVLVVSASPSAVVQAACELVGQPDAFGAVDVRLDGEVYLADVMRPIPYAEGKVAAVERLAPGKKLLAALGDNRFDLAMLRASVIPLAVRPKKALLDHASEAPGLRLLSALPALSLDERSR